MLKKLAILSTASALVATGAFAVDATATADLNLRANPNPSAEILDVIPAETAVTVQECATASEWCMVEYNGTSGWAYGAYLTAPVSGSPAPVVENREVLEIRSVEVEGTQTEGALAGATLAGALIAATIGGPAGAIAAGAALGAGAGAAMSPDDQVITYVRENPVDPVYLEGEVVVGAGIPEGVELVNVPDAQYSYIYVNGLPAVIDPETRRIVRIVR